jgi:16S rRNA (uracil1498-N3)-methyltransferase
MHRFFASPDRCSASVFTLCESEARHASQVLRLEPGDRVEILDGQGTLIEAEILSSNRKSVEVRVIQRLVQPRPVPGVVLLQSLLKGKALDTVLEKSVELGVGQLVLLDTERCVARVPASEAARKRTVWTQTLIEAAKQSRNAWLPELLGPMSLADALAQQTAADKTWLGVASLESGVPALGRVLQSHSGSHSRSTTCGRLAIAIGPEGDFSPGELEKFRACGAQPVSLGPLILRAETAAIAAAAILGDHARSWGPSIPSPAPADSSA